MLSAIKGLARGMSSRSFTPSDAVFPDLDQDRLAARLDITRRGAERGAENLPASDVSGLDQVETEIVGEIDKHRRLGLNKYGEHTDVYAQRLSKAVDARARIESEASTARGDFETSAKVWDNHLANQKAALEQARAQYDAFRTRHGLTERTAVEPAPLMLTIGIYMIMFIAECGMNGYFFARSNALGLLGGVLFAAVISAVNIGFSSLLGYYARWLLHRSFLGKAAGFLCVAIFLPVVLCGLNLAVGHFRDASDGRPWDDATVDAMESLFSTPLTLTGFESLLIVGIGALVSIISFSKGFRLDDPYPRFGHVHRELKLARHAYAEDVEQAHDELLKKRDMAKENLESAGHAARNEINEAMHAAYARQGLAGNLEAFLSHCQDTANAMLGMYREANRKARSAPVPKHFSTPYSFSPVDDRHEVRTQRTRAQEAVERIEEAVDQAVKRIFDAYDVACRSHRSVEEIEAAAGRDATSATEQV